MQFRWALLLILPAAALALACNTDPMRHYETQRAPEFLFQPQRFHSQCGWGRWPGKPLPPGGLVEVSPQSPYAYTRLDTLTLARSDVPALTIAADPGNILAISIWGGSEDRWGLRFCAEGDGDSEAEARGFLSKVSMTRQGGLVTLDGGGFSHGGHPYAGSRGSLAVDAPAVAPITIFNPYGPVRVEDISGPVRVSAPRGRVTILGTTGRVDAGGEIVDYSGAQGTVMLNSGSESDIELLDTTFKGMLAAYATRELRVLLPHGFRSSVIAIVNRPANFVCRADLCSGIKHGKDHGLFTFTYAGNGGAGSEGIHLRSEQLTVVIDNVK